MRSPFTHRSRTACCGSRNISIPTATFPGKRRWSSRTTVSSTRWSFRLSCVSPTHTRRAPESISIIPSMESRRPVGRWRISSTFGGAEGGYGISALPVIAAWFAAHPARSRDMTRGIRSVFRSGRKGSSGGAGRMQPPSGGLAVHRRGGLAHGVHDVRDHQVPSFTRRTASGRFPSAASSFPRRRISGGSPRTGTGSCSRDSPPR